LNKPLTEIGKSRKLN